MTKYVAIAIVALIGGLLFINKDSIFSRNSENAAQVNPYLTYNLTVTKSGSGASVNKVSPQDGGTKSYSKDAKVILTATGGTISSPGRSTGTRFVSWKGCDETRGTLCGMRMTGNKTATATWEKNVITPPKI